MSERIAGAGQCYVPTCGEHIELGQLMCRPHWAKVPAATKQAVTSALRRWKRGTGNLGELRAAQDAAVEAVTL